MWLDSHCPEEVFGGKSPMSLNPNKKGLQWSPFYTEWWVSGYAVLCLWWGISLILKQDVWESLFLAKPMRAKLQKRRVVKVTQNCIATIIWTPLLRELAKPFWGFCNLRGCFQPLWMRVPLGYLHSISPVTHHVNSVFAAARYCYCKYLILND